MRCFCNVRWLTVVTLLLGAATRADEPRSELPQAPEPPSYAQILRVAQHGAPLQGDRASNAPTPQDTPPAPPPRTRTSLALPHLSGETQPSRSSRIADAAAAREQLLDRLTAAPRDDRHGAVGRPSPIDALDDGDEALLRPVTNRTKTRRCRPRTSRPNCAVLRTKIRRCLAIYYFKPVAVENHSPWGVMHTMLAYGVDSQIMAGGQRVNAAGWLSWNGSCRGSRLMRVQQGELEIRQGPGFQGHPGQFLAMLAQNAGQNRP